MGSPIRLRDRLSLLFKKDAVDTILGDAVAKETEQDLLDEVSFTSDEIRLETMTHINTLKNQHIPSTEQEHRQKVLKQLQLVSRITHRVVVPSQYKLQHKWNVWSNVSLSNKRRKVGKPPLVSLRRGVSTREQLDDMMDCWFQLLDRDCNIHIFHKGIDPEGEKMTKFKCILLQLHDIGDSVRETLTLLCDERAFEYDHIDTYWLKLCMVGMSFLVGERYTVVKLWMAPNGVIDCLQCEQMKDLCQLLYQSCESLRSGLPQLLYVEDCEYKCIW